MVIQQLSTYTDSIHYQNRDVYSVVAVQPCNTHTPGRMHHALGYTALAVYAMSIYIFEYLYL